MLVHGSRSRNASTGADFPSSQPITNPMRVNQIPRQIPTVDWWLKPIPSALIAGILPFGESGALDWAGVLADRTPPIGAGFIEINYLMQSLFGSKAYYAFGFLALTSLVVALTTALTTVLFTYFHLCAEDYRCARSPLYCVPALTVDPPHTAGNGGPLSPARPRPCTSLPTASWPGLRVSTSPASRTRSSSSAT